MLIEIIKFFLSQGFAGGVIGSFLTISFLAIATNFTTKLDGFSLKKLSLSSKVLFILSGGLIGALLHYTKEIEMLYCAIIGATWPYLVVHFKYSQIMKIVLEGDNEDKEK